MKTISSSRWMRPCSRRGSGKSAKWSRIEPGLWAGVAEIVSELTVIVGTSLKRSSDPGRRSYKRRPILGQSDCTTEASHSFPRIPRHPRLVRKSWGVALEEVASLGHEGDTAQDQFSL